MPESNEAGRPIPPYVSYRTFRNFITRLQEGVPSRIDRSYLGRTLSGAAGGQLMAALSYLQLIDGENVPQENLTRLADEDTDVFRTALTTVLKDRYQPLFALDLEHATTLKKRGVITAGGGARGAAQPQRISPGSSVPSSRRQRTTNVIENRINNGAGR